MNRNKLLIIIFATIFIAGMIALAPNAIKNEDTQTISHTSVVAKTHPSELLFELASANPMTGSTEVTVYNQDLALVKEKRDISLKNGYNHVQYSDVASRIDPTSVIFEAPDEPGIFVVEQNYEYDLVSNSKLLDKYIDREISVTDPEGNEYQGTLLSHGDGMILKTRNGVVTLSEVAKIEYPDIAGLLTKPTLVWQVYSPVSGNRDILTSYLTDGISWKANYIIKSNPDDSMVDIDGWVTIDNQAGTNFNDAKLKLIAGDINRESNDVPAFSGFYYDVAAMEVPIDQFEEESFFEYHMYTLDRPTNLNDNEIKQISLLSANNVPVTKEYLYDGLQEDKVKVTLVMNNSEASGLGIPLPKGVARVYKADSENQLQFLGEDSIDHTPADEKVSVSVGYAFDIIGERKRSEYKKISDRMYRVSNIIELRNHKAESATITVVEHLSGDWEMISNSHPYTKIDSNTIEFQLTVPADSSATITYTEEYSY
ncbi:hypothetical protein LI82_11205 [Methanococcoides methylutens]|uniref:DUF4139 domain-containing protein n=1 Tax=Methanococcoides methylutens TaxID=2226 RepID=A0A099T201_METMT|nr:DUF4139 domain-containing protein [Methanococcoides methylutens]KGK98276.1 hypothetical protein LI82_11205 [Methanococcoides methylutens]